MPWFAAAGDPLGAAERADAGAYLAGLGLTAEVVGAAGWADARTIVTRTDWSPAWWDGEEALRTALTDALGDRLGAGALHARLTRISRAASDALQGAAAVALTRAGIADAGLAKSAAGAAAMAVHQAALARAAEAAPDHPFAAKFALYAAGRWPLGVYDGTLHIL